MSATRALSLSVFGICIAVALSIGFWPTTSPFDLRFVEAQPSEMIDDNGSQQELVTLSISNTTHRTCYFATEWIVVEAHVENHWVKQPNRDNLCSLNPSQTKGLLLVLPSKTQSCRLYVNYGQQSFIVPAMERLWRAGLRTPYTFNRWIYSLPVSTHSRKATLEIRLPSAAVQSRSAMQKPALSWSSGSFASSFTDWHADDRSARGDWSFPGR